MAGAAGREKRDGQRQRKGKKQWVRNLSQTTGERSDGEGSQARLKEIWKKDKKWRKEKETGRGGKKDMCEPNKRKIEKTHPLSASCCSLSDPPPPPHHQINEKKRLKSRHFSPLSSHRTASLPESACCSFLYLLTLKPIFSVSLAPVHSCAFSPWI